MESRSALGGLSSCPGMSHSLLPALLRIQKLGRFLQIRDEGEGNLAGEGPRRERPFLQSPEH